MTSAAAKSEGGEPVLFTQQQAHGTDYTLGVDRPHEGSDTLGTTHPRPGPDTDPAGVVK